MFFRLKQTKTSSVLQLIRSVWRPGSTPRQEIVASLGSLDLPKSLYKEVAALVEHMLFDAQDELPLNPDAIYWRDIVLARISGDHTGQVRREEVPSHLDGVIVDAVEHGNSTLLGVFLPLEKAWDELGLDPFLDATGFSAAQRHAAKICVYNRLLAPCSEHALPAWLGTTSLPDLLDEHELRDPSRLYRVGDKLLACAVPLESHLFQRETMLFSLKRTIWLYDLTNSYFEGQCERNSKARRSANSKEKRTDCPIISLGLVLDGDGFPICHRVFDGNRHDCKSIPDIIEALKAAAAPNGERPTVILDGGIATDEVLKTLVKQGYAYIVNGKRISRDNFYEDFIDDSDFRTVSGRDGKSPVLVRSIDGKGETILLCHSEARKAKEDAMVSRIEERFLGELEKLQKRIVRGDGRLKLDKGGAMVERAVGGIRKKFTRASRFYDVEYAAPDRILSWRRKDEEYERACALHGRYHLRTNRDDLADDELWRTYISLGKIESSFRAMKSDLGLRPFYHQTDERCDAHVLLTVLAYHLQRWVETRLDAAGHHVTFQHVKRLLQTHCYATLTLPTRTGEVVTLRKPGRPDNRQKAIYDALGIRLEQLPVFKSIDKGRTAVPQPAEKAENLEIKKYHSAFFPTDSL